MSFLSYLSYLYIYFKWVQKIFSTPLSDDQKTAVFENVQQTEHIHELKFLLFTRYIFFRAGCWARNICLQSSAQGMNKDTKTKISLIHFRNYKNQNKKALGTSWWLNILVVLIGLLRWPKCAIFALWYSLIRWRSLKLTSSLTRFITYFSFKLWVKVWLS